MMSDEFSFGGNGRTCAAVIVACLLCIPTLTFAEDESTPSGTVVSGPFVSPTFAPIVVEVDIRTLPRTEPAAPVVEVPEGVAPGAAERLGPPRTGAPDPVAQLETGPAVANLTAPIVNVPGLTAFAAPPDTVGDIGRDHYIQMVNATDFQVFDKNGNDLSGGARDFGALWPIGDPCRSNRGDPIVVYDHLADRWLLSQFAFSGPNDYMCIAISQGPNPLPPTGPSTWYLYTVSVPVFPDYPKFGVWSDAYYMSTFEGSNLGVFALDRSAMLVGLPTSYVRFTTSALSGSAPRVTRILPADLDGAPPAPGTPNYFLRSVDNLQHFADPRDRLEIWAFVANFVSPGSSSFTLAQDLDAGDGLMPFDIMVCNRTGGGIRDCIPQPSTTRNVDALSNRPMMQLKYRSFDFAGDAKMVVNQTVDVSGSLPGATLEVAGVRWYELGQSGGGPWTIDDQGTFAPQPPGANNTTALHRWMGSIAMDKDQNLALGYSISNDDNLLPLLPSILYTGRLATDPPGTMEAEQLIRAGTSAQTTSSRWGDYSAMSVDPVDDCTFWYTDHVAPPVGSGGRPTQIASFQFPSCAGAPPCTLYLDLRYAGGTLNLDFNVGITGPAQWNTWLVLLDLGDLASELWSLALPATDPPVHAPVSFGGVPGVGRVAGVSWMSTPTEPVLCFSVDVVDTGGITGIR